MTAHTLATDRDTEIRVLSDNEVAFVSGGARAKAEQAQAEAEKANNAGKFSNGAPSLTNATK